MSDDRLEQMLARVRREHAEGREDVSLTRAEARAIYSLAFAGTQRGEDCDGKDRLHSIVVKMGPIGWPPGGVE